MEIEELKTCWNTFDKRLAESELVNVRIVKELISQKTKTAFDRLSVLNLYTCVANLFVMAVVFPYVFMNTPITITSFILVEAAMAIGLIPHVRKFVILSRFDINRKPLCELDRLILQYRKVRHREWLWTVVSISLAFTAFYVSEFGINQSVSYILGPKVLIVVVLTLLTLAIACIIGVWQKRLHARQMADIESGLRELAEFENENKCEAK